MDTNNKYESPVITVINIQVEKGFATSIGAGGEDGGWESDEGI